MCLCNRELLTQTEDTMINFDTLTAPSPHTDYSLMHNTTQGRSPGQKGLQVRFREKHQFQAMFVGYSTRFSAHGSIFLQHPR
jgi:sorbitol-specific phosphotransferase system component IIA